MKVDHVLILAAGRGTRMGEVGKHLPKVLWPIFEKSLLELQVAFAKEIAPASHIHINLFHEKKLIKEKVQHLDVDLIEEQTKLDIGGAVHNLAEKLNYSGNLLILNSDQFLFFDKEILSTGLKKLKDANSLLFSFNVNSDDEYNSLEIRDNQLVNIVKNEKLERDIEHQTYTGVSLIRLDALEKRSGESNFFETVANYKNLKVLVEEIPHLEYWDFGTLERYVSSIQKILKEPTSKMSLFLKKFRGIDSIKIDKLNYNSNNGVNLSAAFIDDCKSSLVLELDNKEQEITQRAVIYRGVTEDITAFLK